MERPSSSAEAEREERQRSVRMKRALVVEGIMVACIMLLCVASLIRGESEKKSESLRASGVIEIERVGLFFVCFEWLCYVLTFVEFCDWYYS